MKTKTVKENSPTDNKILGTEKIGKLLRMFAIPCVLSLIIQALYNIVDQIFIGNAGYLPFGNTATGIVYPLTVIALAIGLFIGDGTAACISINQGRNKTENTHKSIGTGITIGLIASIVLMVICFVFCEPILKFLGASGEASIFLPDAKEYSTWIIAGFPLFILACVMNPIIRADGSPKYAMLAMATGAVTNIILDPIFIYAGKMGMNGAALATFIGQAVTFILHAVYFIKPKNFKLTWKSFVPNFKLLGGSLKLGISSFLTQFSIVIISIVSNLTLAKYFVAGAENAIGIFGVVFKVFGIIVSVAIGVSAGSQPIIGYNYGAKKFDRVKETFKKVMLVTVIIGVIATILFEACPHLLLSMFGYSSKTSSAGEIAFGLNSFRIYLGFILLTCFVKAISIFFQSTGSPVKATLIALLRDVIFLVPLTLLLPMISTNVFFWASPISDVLTTVIAIVLTIQFFKKISASKPATETSEKAISIKKSIPGVIVTISREHGAGGREIGQKLAKRLGVPFYDKEVAMLAAQESGLATEFIENVEDKSSLLYSLYLSTEANQTAISAQSKVLQKIAENGTCVIVGRAADYVLKAYNPCKVFVYAQTDFKVKRIMQNYGDDENQAKANIEKSDKKRAMFYGNVTGQDWANKENYDLCVDSSNLGIEQTIDLIESYVKKFIKEKGVKK